MARVKNQKQPKKLKLKKLKRKPVVTEARLSAVASELLPKMRLVADLVRGKR